MQRTRIQIPLQGLKHSSHYKDPKTTTKDSSTLDGRQLSLLEGITQGITTFTCVPMLGCLVLIQRASSQTKYKLRPRRCSHCLQFYKVAWRARLIGGLTSRSSLELEGAAPPPKDSPEEAVEDAGVGLLDLLELSLLDSCQCGSMRLPLGSKARTVTVSSPSKRQQRVSPSRKFKRRENELQPKPRKIKRELSTSNST